MGSNNLSKSMVDYNKNSNFQLNCNKRCEAMIELFLTNDNIDISFNIGDLGCSQGKNSMIIIKKIFDCLVKNQAKINEINVVHEDLPENDFDQVLQCVKDPEIGYLFHPIGTDAKIHTITVGKSFYQVIKPDTLEPFDVIFSLNTLHWLPSKPCNVIRGLHPRARNLTEENNLLFQNHSHDVLVKFFNSRFDEMKVRGKLFINIHRKTNIFDAEDEIWDEYLKDNNLSHSNFESLMMPVYCRSEEEVKRALTSVQDKFKLLYFEEAKDGGPSFSIGIIRAAHRTQVIQGLQPYLKQFSSPEHLVQFVDGYFDKVGDWMSSNESWVSNFWICLEKI